MWTVTVTLEQQTVSSNTGYTPTIGTPSIGGELPFASAIARRAVKVDMKKKAMSQRMDGSEIDALLLKVRDNNDQQAFAALFDHVAPRLKAFLTGRGSNSEAVEDIVQTVMLKIWRRAATFDESKASAITWIFTIARNARIDLIRRAVKPELDPNEEELLPATPLPPDEVVDLSQQAARLRAAIASLPCEQREVLHLAYFEDLSHGEISGKTGIAFGTVKSRLRLALAKLRLIIEE